jgi:hypothetical protein
MITTGYTNPVFKIVWGHAAKMFPVSLAEDSLPWMVSERMKQERDFPAFDTLGQ